MPLLQSNDYSPTWPFRNGHVNSIFPVLFRQRPRVPFRRQRIDTPDGDFLDLDLLLSGNARLALLCHGLEGSSDSQYILGTADLLSQNGWDVAAMNYRGCSGEMNRQARMYHSGATDDVLTAFHFLEKNYDEVALVGYSLGGNLVLKLAGEQGEVLPKKIRNVVAVSVPIDLSACSQRLLLRENFLYENRFLARLRAKALAKHQQFPDLIPIKKLEQVRTLWDFDEHFTAHLHGFDGAEDYYARCNSKQFLEKIRVRTFLLSALDDPFLAPSCFPFELARSHEFFHLLAPRYGGHVGFTLPGQRHYWAERQILNFLEKN